MSIGMTMNVRWQIVLNTTGLEWHTFQHAIAEACEKKYTYEIPDRAFREFTTICDGENEFDVWARKNKDGDLEFAVMFSSQSMTKGA